MRIGPIVITSARKWDAYHHLANVTMRLHQTIWYGSPDQWPAIMAADAEVSDALSRVDPADDPGKP